MITAAAALRRCRVLSVQLRDTKAAYDRLVVAHATLVRALHVEEQRAADMLLAATEPCPECALLENERDDALLRLDAEVATRVWIESKVLGAR